MDKTLYTSCLQCSAHFPYADGVCPKCGAPLPSEEECSICKLHAPRLELIAISTQYLRPQHYHEKCLENIYGGGFPKFHCRQCAQPLNLPTGDWREFLDSIVRVAPTPQCEHCGCLHPAEVQHCEACHLPIAVELGSVTVGSKTDDDGERSDLYEHPSCHQRRTAEEQKREAERKAQIPGWQFWKS